MAKNQTKDQTISEDVGMKTSFKQLNHFELTWAFLQFH